MVEDRPWIRQLDKLQKAELKNYPPKEMLALGLKLMELSGYKFRTVYDRKALGVMVQIYGAENAGLHLRLYWAARVVYLLFAIVFTGLLALLSKPDLGLLFFGMMLAGCILYFTDRGIKAELEKKRTLIRLEFPDFINRLALLINAGMTVEGAWKRIAAEKRSPSSNRGSPLYMEVRKAARDMEGGKPEAQVYEDFAKRCGVPEVMRFASVLVQTMRKGGRELVSVLRICANECWQVRKNAARKLGEEASTKMLLPVMLIFLAILLIAATPAVMALKQF